MARGGVQDLPRAGTLPRRRPPDTAHERKDLPRARTFPTAKASRHGARAKGFAPREKALLGEGLPTRRTSERIYPAQERSPRRRPPDTAHERKDLPRRGSRSPHVPTNGGPPTCRRTAGKTPFGGVAPETARPLPSSFTLKKRLLHEIQFFHGESHVGSRQIFLSFPSVGRCVARERNPVPPFAPHCGRGHRGLRRTGEMCHGFGEMVRRFGECPRGGESLPRGGNGWLRGGGRYCPGLRSFGERFHRLCRANPDACRGPRCSRPTFRNRQHSGEKNFRSGGCSRG